MPLSIDACVAQHQGDRKEQQDRVVLLPHAKGGTFEPNGTKRTRTAD